VWLTTLPPSCAVVMKSGSPNFLEPSGSLRASNGTVLPLPLAMYKVDIHTYIHTFIILIKYNTLVLK